MILPRILKILSGKRMLLANKLISLAMDIMPKDHPATPIWARHLMSASLEVTRENARQRPDDLRHMLEETR